MSMWMTKGCFHLEPNLTAKRLAVEFSGVHWKREMSIV